MKEYYSSNTVFLSYKSHYALHLSCHNNNCECIKWLLSIYTPTDEVFIKSLILMYKHKNMEMVVYINEILESKNIMNKDIIDGTYHFLLNDGEYEIIVELHKLNYKMTCLNLIIECLINIGSIDDEPHHKYFRTIYLEYASLLEKDCSKKNTIFKYACAAMCVENLKWLHNRLKLFSAPYDKSYLKFMRISCDTFNLSVAEWFADLYDEYEISVIELFNDDMIVDIILIFTKLSPEKNLYKQISKNKIPDYIKYKKLGIKTFTNGGDAQCLICMERPIDLVKLNCNHYSCITCLCTWFLNQNQDQICTYCKAPVIWEQCKMVHCDGNEIMKNVHESVKLTDEETKDISERYKEMMKQINKK
jgi:hypothetical protein